MMNSSDPNPGVKQGTVSGNGAATPHASDRSSVQSVVVAANGEAIENPGARDGSPTLSGLLQALRRRWLLAGGLGLLASLLTVFAVFQLMPPKYLVSVRVRVAAKQAHSEDVEFPIFKANMESLVKSPPVINAALNDKLADGREVKNLELIRSRGMDAADWLEKALKTDYLLGPEILRVTLAAENSDEAAGLLQAVANAFLNVCSDMERAKRQPRLTELRNAKERQEETLRKLHNILQTQMKEYQVDDRETANHRNTLWTSRLAAAETQKRGNEDEIIKADVEIVTLQTKLKNIDQFKLPEDVLLETFSKDKVVEEYVKQMAEIDKTIGLYKAKFKEPFASIYIDPLMIEKESIRRLKKTHERELQPELERIYRVKLREDMKRQLNVVMDTRQAFLSRRDSIYKEIQALEQKAKEAGQSNFNVPPQIAITKGRIDVETQTRNQIAHKINEVEMDSKGSRVSVEGRASPPLNKDISRQTKAASVGGLTVFFMVIFGVAFLEFRTCKISLPDDVSQGLGVNVLGTVPAMPVRSRKPFANAAVMEQLWQSQLHESLDAIRTVLLHNARNESLRIIMVTSANSGEGKTTLASQLACSLARAWKRTLVIDGDLRHPATHRLFNLPHEPGLAEVLRGEVEVANAVRATAFSRLWLLPAGNGDSHAIQALAQESVQCIFATLKEQYEFIIVDSPPVLPVTDSLLLAQHADGVLFSILRDVSRTPAVCAAKQKLAPLDVHLLGAVILGTPQDYSNKNYRYSMAGS